MCLHSEGVVEVSVKLAHCNLGDRQACTGRLVVDFLSAGLADGALAAPAFDIVGDVSAAASVFRRVPGEQEFACRELGGGGHKVSWGRGEA